MWSSRFVGVLLLSFLLPLLVLFCDCSWKSRMATLSLTWEDNAIAPSQPSDWNWLLNLAPFGLIPEISHDSRSKHFGDLCD